MVVKTLEKLVVFISNSRCIFENLAFEDLLFRSVDFAQRDVLLSWSNEPAVVVGRHQNPWLESDVRFLEENDIKLARRNSGGGTVYHDVGNVNFSLLTSKARHNRCKNMRIVAKALENDWNILAKVSERNDLKRYIDDSKISGTAAKISARSSYHHFTLLISVNPEHLETALQPTLAGIVTGATRSVRAKVASLRDSNPCITCESAQRGIVEKFASLYPDVDIQVVGLQEMLKMFTDFQKTLAHFRDNEWIFGKTPDFRLQTLLYGNKCELIVHKGRITSILPHNSSTTAYFANMHFTEFLRRLFNNNF